MSIDNVFFECEFTQRNHLHYWDKILFKLSTLVKYNIQQVHFNHKLIISEYILYKDVWFGEYDRW